MFNYVAAYVATAVVMVTIDLVWLGVIAKPFYRHAIGHLLAPSPNVPAAILFYVLFPLGLVIFAVAPDPVLGVAKAIGLAALFGFFAYATYDLTNLATLKGYPLSFALVDIGWGTLLCALAGAAGKQTFDQLSRR